MKRPPSGARRRPWKWGNGAGSALRELEPLAGARLAGLLAFLLHGLAAVVAGLLEGGPELRVHLLGRPGDPVGDSPGLAGDHAPYHVGGDVDLPAKVDRQEGGV